MESTKMSKKSTNCDDGLNGPGENEAMLKVLFVGKIFLCNSTYFFEINLNIGADKLV